MTSSGLCTSTPAGAEMSAAVTSPAPVLRRYAVIGSSRSLETTSCLMLRMISVTSSFTPGMVLNSCSTPSRRMLVTAAPGIDDRRLRRRELPIVYPKPGSSGSMHELAAELGDLLLGQGRTLCDEHDVFLSIKCPLYDTW